MGPPLPDRWRRVLSRFLFAPRSADEGSGQHIPGSDGSGAGPGRESTPQAGRPHRPPGPARTCARPWAPSRVRAQLGGGVPSARSPEDRDSGSRPVRTPLVPGWDRRRKGSESVPARLPSACPQPWRRGRGPQPPPASPAALGFLLVCLGPASLSRWEGPRRARETRPFGDSRPSGPPFSGAERSGPGPRAQGPG